MYADGQTIKRYYPEAKPGSADSRLKFNGSKFQTIGSGSGKTEKRRFNTGTKGPEDTMVPAPGNVFCGRHGDGCVYNE